ncbi:MFS transporter [Priestia aryabhattai]|uniref:MFS transporter n=1 Tax=Priestia megaterium TaxID=1404 RepID=UPI0039B94EF3
MNILEVVVRVAKNELFPTHIRGTAMGFSTGITRITSAIGTLLFPAFLANYGVSATFYACGAMYFIGFIVALFMAPETKNMSLSQASSLNKGSDSQNNTLVQKKTVN